jgi:hypothetical protein
MLRVAPRLADPQKAQSSTCYTCIEILILEAIINVHVNLEGLIHKRENTGSSPVGVTKPQFSAVY